MSRVRVLTAVVLAAVLLLGTGSAVAHDQQRPSATAAAPGSAAVSRAAVAEVLSDTVAVRVRTTPTAFAWTPDGRILVTEDDGVLRVVRNGALRKGPALDLRA